MVINIFLLLPSQFSCPLFYNHHRYILIFLSLTSQFSCPLFYYHHHFIIIFLSSTSRFSYFCTFVKGSAFFAKPPSGSQLLRRARGMCSTPSLPPYLRDRLRRASLATPQRTTPTAPSGGCAPPRSSSSKASIGAQALEQQLVDTKPGLGRRREARGPSFGRRAAQVALGWRPADSARTNRNRDARGERKGRSGGGGALRISIFDFCLVMGAALREPGSTPKSSVGRGLFTEPVVGMIRNWTRSLGPLGSVVLRIECVGRQKQQRQAKQRPDPKDRDLVRSGRFPWTIRNP